LDEVLGLLFLGVYIVGVIALAAGVTYAVIRIFPTERNPKQKQDDQPRTAPEPESADSKPAQAGSLFRRSKRKGT
jgi:hypothetical protein